MAVARGGLRRTGRGAFTLIETALATVIIGVGVVAIIEAHQTFLRNNQWSSHAATATYLANELRELTRQLPRHDPVTGLYLLDDGTTLSLRGWGPDAGELLITDFDDIDDFDGIEFGVSGDFDGPINAFGDVITEIDANGMDVFDESGERLSMQGWSQSIVVEKLDPADFGFVVDDDYEEPPEGTFDGRTVDRFPLRVTVIVEYQGPYDTSAGEVTRVSWIVP